MQRKEAQRKKQAEERARDGFAPIVEPDEQEKASARASTKGRGGEEEERFPGDAGTMAEKNRREVGVCVYLPTMRVLPCWSCCACGFLGVGWCGVGRSIGVSRVGWMRCE